MTEDLVSVIVPVYNVEDYLNRCIESIVEQSYKNIEIILVDDGSRDKCPAMCDEWAERDKRIRVIHKRNEGLGFARNSGIDIARGEYVYFVDSDDSIELDLVEKCYITAKKEKADIVTFGDKVINMDGQVIIENRPSLESNVFSDKEVIDSFLPNLIAANKSKLLFSAWASFYSFELISRASWKFVSEREIISEDMYSMLLLYKYVNKVVILSECLYNYYQRCDSLSNVFDSNRYQRNRQFYDQCVKIGKELCYGDKIEQYLGCQYISNVFRALKSIVTSSLNSKEGRTKVIDVLSDEHFLHVIQEYSLKNETMKRKIFLLAVRYKLFLVSYWMVKYSVKRDGKKQEIYR